MPSPVLLGTGVLGVAGVVDVVLVPPPNANDVLGAALVLGAVVLVLAVLVPNENEDAVTR